MIGFQILLLYVLLFYSRFDATINKWKVVNDVPIEMTQTFLRVDKNITKYRVKAINKYGKSEPSLVVEPKEYNCKKNYEPSKIGRLFLLVNIKMIFRIVT